MDVKPDIASIKKEIDDAEPVDDKSTIPLIVPKTEPLEVNIIPKTEPLEVNIIPKTEPLDDVAESSDAPYSAIEVGPELKQETSQAIKKEPQVEEDEEEEEEDMSDDEVTINLPFFKLKKFLKSNNILLVLCESKNRNVKPLMRLTLKLTLDDSVEEYFLDLALRDDFVFVLLISEKDGVVVDLSTWSENLQGHILKAMQSEKFLSSLTALSPKFGKYSGPLLKFRDLLETFTWT